MCGTRKSLEQVHNWTNEDGESCQQAHYFHCDPIGIPREMTDKEGNQVWFGDYYGWDKLKNETNITANRNDKKGKTMRVRPSCSHVLKNLGIRDGNGG